MTKQQKVYRHIRRQVIKALDDLAMVALPNPGPLPPNVGDVNPEIDHMKAVQVALEETKQVLDAVIK